MDPTRLTRVSELEWRIEPQGAMRVPGTIFATEELIRGMDDKVREQVANVAALPGIQVASMLMFDFVTSSAKSKEKPSTLRRWKRSVASPPDCQMKVRRPKAPSPPARTTFRVTPDRARMPRTVPQFCGVAHACPPARCASLVFPLLQPPRLAGKRRLRS